MIDFKKIIDCAKAKGFESTEIIEQKRNSLNINVFKGNVEKNVSSDLSTITIRGIINGKMASTKIENFDCDVDNVLESLKYNILSIDSEEKNEIFEGSKSYPKVLINDYDFDSVKTSKKIEALLNLEKKCFELDKRIASVSRCAYSESEAKYHIINSKGLDITKSYKYCVAYALVVARENNDAKNANYVEVKKTFEDIDFDLIAKEAVRKAIASLNAKSIPTGKYKVIIENTTMSKLFGTFSSMFSGDSAMHKITPLLGKENQKIMSDLITIIDNPLLEESVAPEPFDDEGVACYEKTIVDKGVLKTMLHSLKTAAFFNTTSTGNGFTGGRGISANGCNMYIKGGTKSKEELISSLDEGLLITGLDGLHAGADSISGNFSLKSSGFYIKDGKIVKPVTLIVISGNFIDLMNNVVEVACDLKYTSDNELSPSILFNSLPVSGE